MAELVDVHFPKAEKIRVAWDNLSPHTPAALSEVFALAEARRLLRILEFHLTPVHGSWLNMAEIELAVLARQCLHRRVPDAHDMAREVAAWETRRNRHQATINWRFTTKEAWLKLKSLYPKESLSQTTSNLSLNLMPFSPEPVLGYAQCEMHHIRADSPDVPWGPLRARWLRMSHKRMSLIRSMAT